MRRFTVGSLVVLFAALGASACLALDKVDPYICPTTSQGSGIDCFLEAIPQTYTMCRDIKSIEIIEFGLAGAQDGVHGAKTEYCIDKHKSTIVHPYRAALREAARSKAEVQSIRQLYDAWLDSLEKLVPTSGETDEGYKQRVVRPYGDFNERIKAIRALAEAAAKPAPKTARVARASKRKKPRP
jgi:hypothetical protein